MIYVADTETTGGDVPEVIQLAYGGLDNNGSLISQYCGWFKPENPILFGAMAVHHIFDSELTDKPPSKEARLPADCTTVIGHKIDYDWEALGKPDVRRVCTMAMARKLWPTLDSHTLLALAYSFCKSDVERTALRLQAKHAHDAQTDVFLCWTIFQAIMREHPCADENSLWEFSEWCRVPDIFAFGKHKGEKIADVRRTDPGYLNWCLRQPDMDPYVLKAIRGR